MAGMTKVSVSEENGVRYMTIVLPMEQRPRPSTSGKTMVVATTNGFMPVECEIDGRQVSISVNACVKP